MNTTIGAYLWIETKPGADNKLIETLSDRFPDVHEVRPFKVLNPYSVLVKVNAENETELRDKIYNVKMPSVPEYPIIRTLVPFIILDEELNKNYIEGSKKSYWPEDRFEVDEFRGPDAFLFIQAIPQFTGKIQEEIFKVGGIHPKEIPSTKPAFRSVSIVTGTYDIIAELYANKLLEDVQRVMNEVNTIFGVKYQFPTFVAHDWKDSRGNIVELLKIQK
jgi:hypothetical protein